MPEYGLPDGPLGSAVHAASLDISVMYLHEGANEDTLPKNENIDP